MTPINVDGNILKMKAFPFFLMDKAKYWLYELAPGTVTSWESMKRASLEKFFPTSRVVDGSKVQGAAICGMCSMQGHLNDQCPQLIENEGCECANAMGYQGQINRGMIHTLTPIIRAGEINQTSSGGSLNNLNNLNNKEDIDSHLSGSIKDHSHQFNLIHNLPKQTQGQQNQAKEMSDMKKQIGQISKFLGQFREQGKLPSLTVMNPKGGFETVNAITLKSGKKVGTNPKMSKSSQEEDEKLQQKDETLDKPTARVEQPLPFMQARNEEDEKDILETFRKVHVNIPLLDAIKQIL
ncbi:uncharacterized protein [Malus domestica]|uniref:uncharacterized protein n=1 Tax=Malus domestica TaxID=3750 RepID=UPI003974B10D